MSCAVGRTRTSAGRAGWGHCGHAETWSAGLRVGKGAKAEGTGMGEGSAAGGQR